MVKACALFAGLVLNYNLASAAPIMEVENGELVGIFNVDVNGTLFDVSFQDGSFVDIFGNQNGLDFTTLQDATAASFALISAISDSPLGAFDSDPRLTLGCTFTNLSSSSICFVDTPYQITNSLVDTIAPANYRDEANDIGVEDARGSFRSDQDFRLEPNRVYANWRLAGAAKETFAQDPLSIPVPTPTALSLLVLGLAGMGFRRFRNA